MEIAPFYVGQEVVANCDHHQGAFKKGDEFRVTGISKCARCNSWQVTVGISKSRPGWYCHTCGHVEANTPERRFSASRFSPKIEISSFISNVEAFSQN